MTISGTSPVVESIRLPKAYGTPTVTLSWEEVDERLTSALHYWLVTTRPDGRPHVVPVDGMWLEGACYFGGDPATMHARNLRAVRGSDPLGRCGGATIDEG